MIELRNINRTYKPKKGEAVRALKNIDLKFGDTGMVFVLGKSGSGKSTLLNVIGGLDKYDDGDLIIQGKSSRDFRQSDFDSYRNTMIGFIFQEYNVLDDFTVAQNIGLALQLQGRKATNEAINDILNAVDLVGYARRKPNELSGGQKQRVAIARALVKEPKVIMADEPTGALDSVTGTQVLETLQNLSKTRLVIVVSHDREYAETYGDRIIEFADGVIISDVTRQPMTEADLKAKPLNFTTESVEIKQGYELTPEDLKVINNYLKRSKADSSIEKIFNQAAFNDTNDKEIVMSRDHYHSIKSKLPFKTSLRIGASSLKNKTVRLVISILLAATSFAMFALADSFASYNPVEALEDSFMREEIDTVAVQLRDYYDSDWGRTYDTIKINDDDLNELNSRYSNLEFIGIIGDQYYSGFSMNYDAIFDVILTSQQAYYNLNFSGAVELSEAHLNSFGIVPMGSNSKLPEELDEIAITSLTYEVFKEFGFRDGSTKININSPDQLINKQVQVNNIDYTIVGVFDTGFDITGYEKLRDSEGGLDYNLATLFDLFIKTSLHKVMIVADGYLESTKPKNGFKIDETVQSLAVMNNQHQAYLNGIYADVVNNYRKSDFTNFKGADFDNLQNNDIYISEDALRNLYSWTSGEYLIESGLQNHIKAYVETIDDQTLYDWAFDNNYTYQPIEELGSQDFAYFRDSVFSQFYSNDGGVTSPFSKSYNDLWVEYMTEEFEPIDINISYWDPYKSETVLIVGRIVGYYTDYEIIHQETFIMNKPLFESFEFSHQGSYSVAVSNLDINDHETLNKLIVEHFNDDIGISIYIDNEITQSVTMVNSFIVIMSKVFLYVAIGFAVFSSLLLINYITISISYKKREIGILRAIGARGADVTGIFLKEAMIIALINFLVATGLLYFGIIALNDQITNGFGLPIEILKFGIRQVGLILLLSVFIAFISSVIPVSKVARKRPIDAIRDK